MKQLFKVVLSGIGGAVIGGGLAFLYEKMRKTDTEVDLKNLNETFETVNDNLVKALEKNQKIISEYGGATSFEKPPLEELKQIVMENFDEIDEEEDLNKNVEIISEDDYSDDEYESYEKLTWVYYENDDMLMQEDQLVTDEEQKHYLGEDIGWTLLCENLSKENPRIIIRNNEARCDIEILWAYEWGYNG